MSLLLPPPVPGRLSLGDRVPDLAWRDTRGRHIALDLPVYAGRVSILYVGAGSGSGVTRDLMKLRDLHSRFRARDIQVFAVMPMPVPDNAALGEKLKLPFPVLSDMSFAFGRALGLAPGAGPGHGGAKKKAGIGAIAIADANQRIEKIVPPAGDGRQAIRALAHCEKRIGQSRVPQAVSEGMVQDAPAGITGVAAPAVVGPAITAQAPVLILPNVIDSAHCARLIRAFETGQRYEGGVASPEHGSNVPIQQIKVREDVALADNGAEAQALFAVLRQRLFPEMRKAFHYRATRAETLRIGCYTAEAGGHFVPHRDDTTPYTAHRRFAMSLNLNAGDYEGGYLRFPEYGPQLYGAGTGGAIVFSCSLLHEATRVTRGRRFVLLGFFYGQAEQAIRDKLHASDNSGG